MTGWVEKQGSPTPTPDSPVSQEREFHPRPHSTHPQWRESQSQTTFHILHSHPQEDGEDTEVIGNLRFLEGRVIDAPSRLPYLIVGFSRETITQESAMWVGRHSLMCSHAGESP